MHTGDQAAAVPAPLRRLSDPFRKTLADAYDYLGLAVAANVAVLLVLLLAAAAGAAGAARLGARAQLVGVIAAVWLAFPACAYGLSNLAVAVARRDDPSLAHLAAGIGRAYLGALAFASAGGLGFVLVSFMMWFWGHAPVTGTWPDYLVCGGWGAAGLAWLCVQLLGWPLLVLSGGRTLYTLRLALALMAVGLPTVGALLAHLAAVALAVVLPPLLRWPGVPTALSFMVLVFLAISLGALLCANAALWLVEELRLRKDAAPDGPKEPDANGEGSGYG